MSSPMPGGRRRVDRVLAPGFLDGLAELTLEQVRERRLDAEQEEADLSFLRRMLHGRLDLIAVEQDRRSTGQGHLDRDALIAALSRDEPRGPRGSGKYLSVEPTRVSEHRRAVERALADAVSSDVGGRSDDELAESLTRLRSYEAEVSQVRRAVQAVVDALSAEIGRRYRDGSASVDALLTPEP